MAPADVMQVDSTLCLDDVNDVNDVNDVKEELRTTAAVARALDVEPLDPSDLQSLTCEVRETQRSLELLLVRIGAVAHRQEQQGRGRGAQGTLLGDGNGVCGRTAQREATRSILATTMSEVGRAVTNGRLGGEQIDAIARAVKDLSPDQVQQLDTPALIDAAEVLPIDVFSRHVRDAVKHVADDQGRAETTTHHALSSWRHWVDDETGMGHISARFDPERYEAVVGAVEARLRSIANDGGATKDANLAAEAAFQLLTTGAEGRSNSPHINVVVDLATLRHGRQAGSVGETAAGAPLPSESLARLACDAVMQRVVLDEGGVPVNVGRRSRTATDGQWQALRSRYRTCAWTGCDQPLARCQAHHIHEWERGGDTDLCNLVPLCNRHHHAVHEGGWSVKLCPTTRRLDIIDRDRRPWASAWPDRPMGGRSG